MFFLGHYKIFGYTNCTTSKNENHENIKEQLNTSIQRSEDEDLKLENIIALNPYDGRRCGIEKNCDFVKEYFMKMPFRDDMFDVVYAIEATCHATGVAGCYKELKRLLKLIQLFAEYKYNGA